MHLKCRWRTAPATAVLANGGSWADGVSRLCKSGQAAARRLKLLPFVVDTRAVPPFQWSRVSAEHGLKGRQGARSVGPTAA